jgi:hypothetical protein
MTNTPRYRTPCDENTDYMVLRAVLLEKNKNDNLIREIAELFHGKSNILENAKRKLLVKGLGLSTNP